MSEVDEEGRGGRLDATSWCGLEEDGSGPRWSWCVVIVRCWLVLSGAALHQSLRLLCWTDARALVGW